MNVEIDAKKIGEIVSAALLQDMTPEKREQLIKDSISSLLTPQPYDGKTVIKRAFDDAVKYAAERIITEKLADNAEFKAKIESLLNDVIAKTIDTNREQTIDRMSSIFAAWLRGDRY